VTLAPVKAGFAVFGLFWGSWAVAVVDVQRTLHISDAGIGGILALSLSANVVVNVWAGSLAERWGTPVAMGRVLTVWGMLTVASGVAPSLWVFTIAFGACMAAAGAVDVVMNVAATAALSGEPGLLIRFHGFYNAGAVAGAAVTGLAVRASAPSWRWVWVAIACIVVVVAAWSRWASLPAAEPVARQSLLDSFRQVARDRLVAVAVAFGCIAAVEGAIGTWGVVYLRRRLTAGLLVGAGAYVLGQALATATRVLAGPRVGRLGGVKGAALGAGLAGAGLALEALSPWPLVAAAGLALAAMSISLCWPLLLAFGTSLSSRPATVVGGLTAAGYLGWIAGPPVIGWIAGVWNLRAGLLLGVALGAVGALTPRRVGRAPAAYPASPTTSVPPSTVVPTPGSAEK